MKILIIGNGGREHALAWKASQSKLADVIFVAPGNPGTMMEPHVRNIDINTTDIDKLLQFAHKEKIDLTIVGPEIPITMGIVDKFRMVGLNIFAPTKSASQIESSKIFTKKFLSRHNIPTPRYECFSEIKSALSYINQVKLPVVIKANGLAAGKGVIITKNRKEAESIIQNMLSGNLFGNAGKSIIIEEFFPGEEISFIVMVDGTNVLPMATSQDYKRIGNKNTGLNTGGMGSRSPAMLTKKNNNINQYIMNHIIYPTVSGMALEGNPYTGFLYAGVIINELGKPLVIEFNCRLGDPETQSLMMRLKSDLIEVCMAGCHGILDQKEIEWDSRYSLSLVLSSGGYPSDYSIDYKIYGLPKKNFSHSKIFHAGTGLYENKLITKGGRVLCISTMDKDIKIAKKRLYEIAQSIYWQNIYYRTDIGY
ncbi:phosphoribosylamine--glycine ligase [Candidatus Pantoea edessiphila]|uniref:Phosphoribosylamine--glycine ligase n=1 Tax=Candidatus Pantoea edessiphila TaxID=2044610 RepID=A0A2P5SYC4_9GAMM|nr:phosphoribosylamine--glycine ligase [Candidatus Pantoea edessiphila]MBK4775542.1 phosphoribosylamine--glycine ligase [Pantoea sp. Edef]PPI87334.1 phosphoribosylamine--glycine ligase [Candidatus Pantoea edessiphila]